MTVISWRDVNLYDPADAIECTGADRPDLMRRLRDEGGIPDWYTCTRDEYEAAEDGDVAADLGPRLGQIDWSGLEAVEYRVRVGGNHLGELFGSLADAAQGAVQSGLGVPDARVTVWGPDSAVAFDGPLSELLEETGLLA